MRHLTNDHSYRGGAKGNRIESSEKKNYLTKEDELEDEEEDISSDIQNAGVYMENANQASDEEMITHSQDYPNDYAYD